MLVLALDSTEPSGGCALWLDGVVLVERAGDPARTFSDRLPRDLLALLDEQSLTPADVTLFAAGIGPGSLTGLRVGLATIQGLAFATGAPVVGVSALDAAAHVAAAAEGVDAGDSVAVWFDARRGEVFTALYEATSARGVDERIREVDGPAVGEPDQTAARWLSMVPRQGAIHVVTDTGAGGLVNPLRDRFGPRAAFVPRPRLASAIAEIAADRARRGLATPPHALQPLYVRRPDAELARERRAMQQSDEGRRQ